MPNNDSIIWVRELPKEEANISESQISYPRFFLVKTVNQEVSEETVRYANGIPRKGETHPRNSALKATEFTIRREDNTRIHWLVQISYTWNDTGGRTPDEGAGEDATDLPPVVKHRSSPFDGILSKAYQEGDSFGSPTLKVQNSALAPYDNPPTLPERGTRIEIEHNRALTAVNPNVLMRFIKTVNSESIVVGGITIAAYEGLIDNIAIDPVYDDDGTRYFKVSFAVLHNPKGWRFVIRDQGYFYWTGGVLGGTQPMGVRHTKTEEGEKTSDQPYDLNGAGGLRNLKTEGVFYGTYSGYYEVDWDNSVLDLPEDEFPE